LHAHVRSHLVALACVVVCVLIFVRRTLELTCVTFHLSANT
jgi:hypothetical protein